MGKKETSYTKQEVVEKEVTEQINVYPRPRSHAIRCTLTLLGLGFWMCFTVCVPSAKKLKDIDWDKVKDAATKVTEEAQGSANSEPDDLLLMLCVGSGVAAGCAWIFMFVLCYGVRRTRCWKIFGYVLLVLYCLGAALHLLARGRRVEWVFNSQDDGLVVSDSKKNSERTKAVGRLIAEAAYLLLALLITLPDFGFLVNWEDTVEVKETKKKVKEKKIVEDKDAKKAAAKEKEMQKKEEKEVKKEAAKEAKKERKVEKKEKERERELQPVEEKKTVKTTKTTTVRRVEIEDKPVASAAAEPPPSPCEETSPLAGQWRR
eukprot:TRINITY_DN4592_c0_g1_i4.p1 TRINITY_DN4592_c0_g1~~TRINITY_DN4592_c0_g1_i4.p1  ORF type:complete len:348 (+),score=154.59 TRINITY_DN4592_c0_g1_i4:92-1045(+)